MIILDVENIKLPSVNRKYGYNPQLNRFYLNKKYRLFADTLTELMTDYSRKVKFNPPYTVRIFVKTYLDIDNFVKPVFDGMKKAGIIDDDKNIHHFAVIKEPAKKGVGSKIIVEIETWQN